jgi:hypothetical protein
MIRIVGLTLAAVGAAFLMADGANADTLTFDAPADTFNYTSNYTEKGYTFSQSAPFNDFIIQNSSDASDGDSSATSGVLKVVTPTTLTLDRLVGGSEAGFDLGSIQFGDVDNEAFSSPPIFLEDAAVFTATFHFMDGTSSAQTYTTDQSPGLKSLDFNLTNLLSAVFSTSTGFQLDNVNVNVAATPIPPALLMFMTALGGLGFVGYRRQYLRA